MGMGMGMGVGDEERRAHERDRGQQLDQDVERGPRGVFARVSDCVSSEQAPKYFKDERDGHDQRPQTLIVGSGR